MATTPREHLEKIIAAKLWLQPLVAKKQFRDLFRVPTRRQETVFLRPSGPAVLPPEWVRRHAAHLNAREVIAAYRACVAGVPPTIDSPSRTDELAHAAANIRHTKSYGTKKTIAKDISKLMKKPSTGEFADVLPLRAKLGLWLQRQTEQLPPREAARKLDALLLQLLFDKHPYSEDVRKRLTRQLTALRKREAAGAVGEVMPS